MTRPISYEEYNELKTKLKDCKQKHKDLFLLYIQAQSKIDELETESQKINWFGWNSFLRGFIAGLGISIVIHSLTFFK
jgi:hypothetical protein